MYFHIQEKMLLGVQHTRLSRKEFPVFLLLSCLPMSIRLSVLKPFLMSHIFFFRIIQSNPQTVNFSIKLAVDYWVISQMTKGRMLKIFLGVFLALCHSLDGGQYKIRAQFYADFVPQLAVLIGAHEEIALCPVEIFS